MLLERRYYCQRERVMGIMGRMLANHQKNAAMCNCCLCCTRVSSGMGRLGF